MASNTENLGLLKKNPSTDGADTFNIQTMLNDNWDKLDANAGTVAQTLANILKPTTPPIIGLPPSTTPDGMFQALGNTGELHVWRKTTAIPAGTTTTYPVSTNPNAYQEGSDAKPAWYTLGDVKRGTFAMATGNVQYSYASSVSVSDDGTVSLVSPSSTTLSADASSRTIALSMRGKYVKATSSLTNCGVPFSSGSVVFLPADAVVSGTVDIDRYQPVTGYAAIPAGTTIEYLGKLGDKAREQVLSYVGTGTYGSSNPNSLTFDFVPRFCVFTGDDVNVPYLWTPGTTLHAVYLSEGGSSVGTTYNWTVNTVWDSASKKIQWHSTSNAKYQYNTSGKKYRVIAIG